MKMDVVKIEEIKRDMYINAYSYDYGRDFDASKINTPPLQNAGYRSRITDYKGVYKTSKIYKITLTKDDMAKLSITKSKDDYSFNIKDLCAALDIDVRNIVCFYDYEYIPFHVYIYRDSVHDGYFGRHGKDSEASYLFALRDDFIKCKPNKKEIEIKKCVEDRENNAKLVNAFARDNIKLKLKEAGYTFNEAGELFFLRNVEQYNKFVDNAIEHYLNYIVKDLQVTIPINKTPRSKQHTRCSNDTIFNMERVILNFNKE